MPGNLTISGPAGGLEARLTEPAGHGITRMAVLCHPHPLYGGSMDDGVLGVVADALLAEGCHVLRFNFRGVGASDGQHDGNGGEVADLAAVLDWVRASHLQAPILLGGYSFGASTVCRLLNDTGAAGLERVLLIAPPLGRLPVPQPGGGVRADVFAGDADPFIDHSALQSWDSVTLHRLPGADHFFSGHWQALQAQVRSSLRG